MTVAGIGSFVVAVLNWRETDFGVLTTEDMRLPLLGMLLIVAGSQVILGSFLLSLTRIGETEDAVAKLPTTPTTTASIQHTAP